MTQSAITLCASSLARVWADLASYPRPEQSQWESGGDLGGKRELVHFFTHSFVGATDSMLPAPRTSRPLTSHRQCQAECHLGPGLGEGGEGGGPAQDVTSESILVS